GTERVAAILRKKHTHVQLVLLRFQPIEKAAHAAPAFSAFDDRFLLNARKLRERHGQRNLFRLAKLFQLVEGPFMLRLGPGLDCAFFKTQTGIGYNEIKIKSD